MGLARARMPEVHALSGERPDARSDEHQPREHRTALSPFRQEVPGLLGEVEKDRVAVEHGGVAVCDHWNLGVRVERRESRRVLFALARVHGYCLVRQATFPQEQRHLHGVRRERVVELQHGERRP